MEQSVFSLILQAGLVVKFVMLVLLFFSVVSWAIIIMKYSLKNAEQENSLFIDTFQRARDPEGLLAASRKCPGSPIANIYREAYEDRFRGGDEIRRALRRYGTMEAARLEKSLGFLATTGSSTPFIGLFGTVWGIMTSFMGIGTAGKASLAVVAPGIAEALIATAMGLVAAIPAVIAYNYFLSRSRSIILETEDFSEEIQDFFEKHGIQD
jgi:biopolymer transport protein TolQ